MVLRAMVHRHMRDHELNRRCGPPLGKATKYALIFAILCAVWLAGKEVERVLFPVIKDFEITQAYSINDHLYIHGEFDKVRGCTFVDIVAYSGKQFVSVIFAEAEKAPVVSRMTRHQTFGPWVLIPEVKQLELYAHHICITGEVESKLFSGAIVTETPPNGTPDR